MEIFTEKKLEIFKKLILDCGTFMVSAAFDENDSSDVMKKAGDADFVTVYDKGVQEKLIAGLSELFPDAHFFAEEKDNFADDTKSGLCFVIDPIDGTTNFIHNLGASTISVGALFDGKPVFGCVYDPYRKDLFVAVDGKGAYKNGERISVSDRDMPTAVISFGTTPYRKKEYADEGFRIAHDIFCNCSDLRRSGSAALDMANIACGKLDGFFECILCPWDYMAGTVLIKEAGGTVTDFTGADIGFAEPSPLRCSNGIVQNKLLALINR